MKITEISKERLLAMTPEQKWRFCCDGICDDGKTGDVALLLGGRPSRIPERVRAAVELYLAGRVRYIMPTGGVKWDFDGEQLSECEFMVRMLLEAGIPEEVILPENEATTTRENIIYGTLQINRKTKFYGVKHIIIVTAQAHMKRSLALARAYLPRMVTVSGYPAMPTVSKEEWMSVEENFAFLDKTLNLMKDLADHRIIEDVEVDLS